VQPSRVWISQRLTCFSPDPGADANDFEHLGTLQPRDHFLVRLAPEHPSRLLQTGTTLDEADSRPKCARPGYCEALGEDSGEPPRREFHLLTLLSGSRPTALKNVRIEHVDLRQRLVHISKPKGGEEKAFDVPLSRPMVRCIIRAIRLGRMAHPEQAKYWLFPADSEIGHLVEHKEERDVLSKWGNDLRQSYRTLAQAAGVSELDCE